MSSKTTKCMEDVICGYCQQKMMRKNMKRHTQHHHPGKTEKYSSILSAGQSTLVSLLPVPGRAKPKVVDTLSTNQVSTPIISELEETFENVTLNSEDEPIKREHDVNSNDKKCIDSENIIDSKNTSLTHELLNDIKGAIKVITGMLVNLSENKPVLEKTEIPKKSNTKVLDSMDTQLIKCSNEIKNCKDVQQLMEMIQELGYKFYEEESVIICVDCSQASTPSVSQISKKVGVFSFDLASYMLELENDPNKQPRIFLNIKKKIAEHELNSQFHNNLKEKKHLQEKVDKERQSRNERIGLNLFNLRYTGIMNGKSLLSFERDVLTANLNGTDTGNINNSRKFAKELTGNIVSVMKGKLAKNLSC